MLADELSGKTAYTNSGLVLPMTRPATPSHPPPCMIVCAENHEINRLLVDAMLMPPR